MNRYSGTAVWSKIEANSVIYDIPKLNDQEGRFIQVNFPNASDYYLHSEYCSNWNYRLDTWDPKLTRDYLRGLSSYSSIPVIYCGDNNIANKEDIWFGDCLEYRMQSEEEPVKKRTSKNCIKKNLS